ncbi:MAG: LPS-assembly protein LptD [Hydrogenophaga sp.]|uniref:LPS-assembly protein LptD n=1 Tax=Hydrogenophaga sp. TaxID=1904254 RepID=UPI00257D308D|nr:LPS assembly protein LptD [Hydrogenophaga sp.]MBL0945930.1 LPS-assembly protein LptD [Hydrogenophaga sp.]
MKRRPTPPRPAPRLALAPLAAAVVGGLTALAAQAQSEGLALRPSLRLQENLPAEAQKGASAFVSGQRIEGKTGGVTTIEGEAEVRRHDMVIRADRLTYDENTGEATAQGNVLINRNGDRYSGPSLRLNADTFIGSFEQPQFEILRSGGRGDAARLDFLGEDKASAHQARYSTCPRVPGADWMPDWLVRAKRIDFDNVEQTGAATNGVLEFKGVPILGAPYFTFPLTDERKSGLLPPSINLDSLSGFEYTQPYYLNLAPNYDLTLYPTVMTKRGIDLGGEFRYLRPDYSGRLRGSFMPSDRLRNDDRWGYTFQHNQTLTDAINRLGGGGSTALNLNVNRVSDDNYWRDFPRSGATLTQRLLPADAQVSWTQGPWSLVAGAYTWQTLQDIDAPIIPPYDRVPALSLSYQRGDLGWGIPGDTQLLLSGGYTRFESNPLLTGQPNGERALAIAQFSHRWQAPGWFVEPRARLHATQYRYDSALANGQTSASRALPTLSLDSGLVFERDASYFGRAFTQTLEPRAYFTWTPYRDQSLLPNYDSAATDFNFATIYSDNVFTGNDRISDTRALTLGVSSRLLDPRTGAEIVRLGIAQRYLLRDQDVTLPNAAGLPGGDPVTERFSDVLIGARVQWSPRWLFDTNFQYNPTSQESVRTTLSARYMPGPFRTLSAAWRFQRGNSEQLDLGWQWPLSGLFGAAPAAVPGRALGEGQWYSVGRINYSVPDRKIVDLVAGFEYDAGCWIGRIVLERLQRSAASANQRILFQLEFTGFSRIGSNPLQTLRDNVPRYQYLREEITPPSRFERHD